MQRMFTTAAIAGALATGFAGTVSAQTEAEIAQMRADMARMQAELSQLKAQQEGDWLTEARAEEVRGLINEVMADANTRASLLQEGAMAGIDSKGKIFLKSADGDFSMNVSGQIQFRYILNNVDDSTVDETLSGFQARRTKLKFEGEVADDWEYTIVLAGDRDGGSVIIEDAIITQIVNDNMSLDYGIMKLPFARQELISSSRQVSVDRGLATEFFTLNRSEGVQFNYDRDKFKFAAMISDGANNSNSDYNTTGGGAAHDFAITARGDYMAIGDDWGNAKHAFGGVDETHLFIGGAVFYGQGEFGAAAVDSQVNWTLDALMKTGNFGIMGAVYGSMSDANAAGTDSDAIGFYGQVDYKIGDTKWDIFARYDYIDDDTADELNAVTVGANYHVNKNVKVTGDVIFVLDSDNPDGLGFLADGEDSDGVGMGGNGFGGGATDTDILILRLQLQLLF